ncbi:MAG: hypothetical protein HC837_20945 [Chloroflexaceae bacterium]|nr:hypothetical protein [Chloroflexaceae bacterium]
MSHIQGPTLLLTLYVNHWHTSAVTKWLVEALQLPPDSNSDNQWQRGALRLYSFALPGSDDTTALQLSLDEPESGVRSWIDGCQRLYAVALDTTDGPQRLIDQLDQWYNRDMLWGYTLIYMAELTQPTADESSWDGVLAEMLPIIDQINPQHSTASTPLSQTPLAGGMLWLLDEPTRNLKDLISTVYLALAPPGDNDRLLLEGIYGPAAALIMPDMIMHKSYYLLRDIASFDLVDEYKEYVDDLTDLSIAMMSPEQQLAAQAPPSLDAMGQQTANLLGMMALINEQRIRLQQQHTNYQRWYDALGGRASPLVCYQLDQIHTAIRELELLIERGRSAIEASRTAIELIETQIAREQNARQERISRWLAIAGVVLATPQVFTWDVTCAWLATWGLVSACENQAQILPLLGQFALMLLIGSIVWWFTQRMGKHQ